MPGQDARKSSKRAVKPPARAPRGGPAAAEKRAEDERRTTDLEAECERLRAELAAARQRIGELETARDAALDRIAWVIDSLHNLIDE